MFWGAYKQEHKREDTEYVCYSIIVSDNKDKEEYPKQGHTPKGHAPLFKPVSLDGNLRTTTAREDNVHNLSSSGTHITTQPSANVILTNTEEKNMSSKEQQAEMIR